MADIPPEADPTADPGEDTGDETGGTPRWVYVFGVSVVALVVLFVIIHLAGGGLGGHAP